MQTLAQILAGIPADPYSNQSQGIAPLLQQQMQAAMMAGQQPGMDQEAPGMQPQGSPGGLPPELLQQLILRHQQQQQQPGLGSMGDPMGGGY